MSRALAAPPPPPGPDHLSRRDFERLAAYIFHSTGIKMPESKITMLEGRLRRRVRATGQPTIAAYCAHIFEGDNLERESVQLINAVTTNKTDFFREPQHFDFLAKVALPELSRRGTRTIRAWSAACSTGPEPYTMAMVLDDHASRHPDMRYGILATDLDTEVLETARRGIYPAELVAPVPERLARQYVLAARDPASRQVRITPALRSAIGFAQLNLMDARYPVGAPMHLIFCRNVLIYFDKPTQKQVIARLIECLSPEGYLFLGHSESIAGFDLPLAQVSGTVFRRS